ncbi:MAG: glycogen debranching N-terminal domain-containing protein [Candidatus Binatia bacterium]
MPTAKQKIIRVSDEYYILAKSALADDRTRVLKQGEMFAVFNRHGDIRPLGLGEQGIYYEGTRFLSDLEMTLGDTHPLLLSSTTKQDNALLAVDLTNPDLYLDNLPLIPRGTLHLSRSVFLWQGCCFEQTKVTNYGLLDVAVPLSFHFGADFADIFEVRGMKRVRRGNLERQLANATEVLFTYTGLDGVARRTRIHYLPRSARATNSSITFEMQLAPKEDVNFSITISCESGEPAPSPLAFNRTLQKTTRALETTASRYCSIYTSNEQFNDWLNRSVDDACMMTTETAQGPYPYAGIPWFSTPFGRDGIISALLCLWVNPYLARGVLAYLADTQAQTTIEEQDAEPGKILHETRKGEMATLKEIPFARYYGSVDATPLFVVLAGSYYERTSDRQFLSSIWPNIEKALEWIDRFGDIDGDGFVEYLRHSPRGLAQQGWKDSYDSVFHADGTLAYGPLALCEVQGYVYAAKMAAAKMASVLGYAARSKNLKCQADALQERFESSFWSDELSMYVLALDGDKQPCKVRASNAGHCLLADIAGPDHATALAHSLLSEEFFSGWGIRTVAASEARYNPMSYHNGSVWPHDNALIAYGLARYGFQDMVHRVLGGLFDISIFVELHRLPELVCGFSRRPGEAPTLYPVACAPQFWAAASVFMLLQACLGLSIDATKAELRFSHPSLPKFLEAIQIKNLGIGTGSVDLAISRHEHHENDVAINIIRKDDDINVVTIK